MKLTKQCPVCNGTEIYRHETESRGTNIDLLPGISHWFESARLELYVCGTCGHYQLFVPPFWLPDVKDKWTKYS